MLGEISEVQCRENRVAEAVSTARAIESPRARCSAFVDIGGIVLRDGAPGRAAQPIALAEEAAGAIADASERARSLAKIARLRLDVDAARAAKE